MWAFTRHPSHFNNTVSRRYALGNLVSIASPLGHVETRFVDGGGHLLQVTGARTRFAYNAVSQVTKITDPLNGQLVQLRRQRQSADVDGRAGQDDDVDVISGTESAVGLTM